MAQETTASTTSDAAAIVDAVGGPDNITSLTHCATRLRFQLRDGSGVDKDTVEKIPAVMGAVPQSGNRYQVVIGGAVATVYNEIMALPQMSAMGSGGGDKKPSDAEVKAAARQGGIRGKFGWVDTFFEFLSDSFRPIIGVLLGASLFITFMALMSTLGVIGNWSSGEALCQVYWLVGTVIGLGLGALIPPQVVGFDFALAALFVILAQHHYYRRERRPLLLLGALAIVAALVLVRLQWLDGRQALAVAIAMLLMLLFFVPRQSIMGEKS